MAILLRSPLHYRALLEEALGRAGVPAHFARGTARPDPAGRAFLALLACKAQGLSAVRFAEYLSLGEVPQPDEAGAPPPAPPPEELFAPPDEDLLPEALSNLNEQSSMQEPVDAAAEAERQPPVDPEIAPVRSGSLRAPRRWERLLVEAAVIGSRDRWEKRLSGLHAELEDRLTAFEHEDEARAGYVRHEMNDLAALRAYALPLLDALLALPERAPWSEWLEALAALAARALRHPERVQSLLTALAPLGPLGPVGLSEVRQVLERRLCDLAVPPAGNRFGKVYVAPIEAARGLAFDVVFTPGLAERLFPPRLTQDPLLRDREREQIDAGLETNVERLGHERLLLRLAAGAASQQLVLSYPRIDAQQSRARVPSFYGLEVMRAAKGVLPGYAELARTAEQTAGARAGWPAPEHARDAIDEAEHDLALLKQVLQLPDEEARGTARYLLDVNPHLARALRARARRAAAQVAAHRWPRRSVARGAQRARQAHAGGALLFAHRAAELRGLSLQVPPAGHPPPGAAQGPGAHRRDRPALARLADAQGAVRAAQAAARRGPPAAHARKSADGAGRAGGGAGQDRRRVQGQALSAIPRVWEDGVSSVRADLRHWLALMADHRSHDPVRFELAFGLPYEPGRDEASTAEPALLDSGIRLRGSIDLVERRPDGHLRATDYKSGKKRASKGTVIGGGGVLQPVLYALGLEKLFPGQPVEDGRLWYCTYTGEFEEVPVPLDTQARESVVELASALGEALSTGFLARGAAPPRVRVV